MMERKIDFDDMEWENPMEGVKSKTFRRDGKQVRLVVYTKAMQPHWCEKGHHGLILEGIFEIEYPDGEIRYKEGDGVFIPPGPEHRHRAVVVTESVKALFVEDV